MTFPTGTVIPTTNVASADSDPSQARADIYNLIVAFNQLVASVNAASGVAVLDGSGLIANSSLPTTLSPSGNYTITPSTKIVNINDVLRLAQRYTADMSQLSTATAGDLIYLVDGDLGNPCLAVYSGSSWRVVRLMTQVGNVGATLTARATLTATVV
jgi:hypothetical protein